MKTKNETRKYIEQLFLEQDKEDLSRKDPIIGEKVLEYIFKNDVQNICIYENMCDEVSTESIISQLRTAGKSIYTPQVIGETEMILIDENYEVYEKEIDIFIIPARAFTQDGKRLGRGKGYYDRFLSHTLYKKSKKIGICYDFQLISELKTEKHDININLIIHN